MKLHYLVPKGDRLNTLFEQHKDNIIKFASNPSDYNSLTQKFVKDYIDDFDSFRKIKFPFAGFYFVDNLELIFENMPEFIYSIIELGFDKLVSLGKAKKSNITSLTILSKKTLIESSALLHSTIDLTIDYLRSPLRSPDLRNQIFDNLALIEIDRAHTDILGCLQIIHEYLFTVVYNIGIHSDSDTEFQSNIRITDHPIVKYKNTLLEELVRQIVKSLYVLDYLILPINKEQTDKHTKSKKMQVMNLFLNLDNIRWKNVEIILTSNDAIRIKTKGFNQKFNYTALGMDDGRKKDLPNTLWRTLLYFAENNGELSHSEGITFLTRSKIEKTVSRLRSKLNLITGLKEKPITNYSKTESYITKFKILDNRFDKFNEPEEDEPNQENLSVDNQHDYLYENDDQDQYPDLDHYDSQT